MRIILVIPLLLAVSHIHAQENPISVFGNLVDGTWVSTGKQLGVEDGKTEVIYEWGLNGKIVKVQTFTTDPETLQFGLRNEGIRAYNFSDSTLIAYEFDKLGGITISNLTTDGKNIHYNYEYEGLQLRDTWKYIDKDSYQFIVGIWKNGAWEKKFHESTFHRK